eukprot:3522624-Pyramimonas_sp.AAC.1
MRGRRRNRRMRRQRRRRNGARPTPRPPCPRGHGGRLGREEGPWVYGAGRCQEGGPVSAHSELCEAAERLLP